MPRHGPVSAIRTLALTASLGLGACLAGCGEDTPEFEDLTRPAEEEAVPLEAEQLRKTPEEREASEERASQRLEAREQRDIEEALPGEESDSTP